MRVALVIVVGTIVLVALIALADLTAIAVGRLSRVFGRGTSRGGRRRAAADIWTDVRETRRDAEALQSRPDPACRSGRPRSGGSGATTDASGGGRSAALPAVGNRQAVAAPATGLASSWALKSSSSPTCAT